MIKLLSLGLVWLFPFASEFSHFSDYIYSLAEVSFTGKWQAEDVREKDHRALLFSNQWVPALVLQSEHLCLATPTHQFMVKSESCSVMSDSLWPHGLYSPWNSPGQNTGLGSLSFLQRLFPTQGWNPGLPHCRQILYQLSHQGSPRILEWVAYPFSSMSSQPRNQTGSLTLQVESLPAELPSQIEARFQMWWCLEEEP